MWTILAKSSSEELTEESIFLGYIYTSKSNFGVQYRILCWYVTVFATILPACSFFSWFLYRILMLCHICRPNGLSLPVCIFVLSICLYISRSLTCLSWSCTCAYPIILLECHTPPSQTFSACPSLCMICVPLNYLFAICCVSEWLRALFPWLFLSATSCFISYYTFPIYPFALPCVWMC